MYELYTLGQSWAKILSKTAEPAFNNPIVNWYMDQYTEAILKLWFWPGQMVVFENQLNEFVDLVKQSNICYPNK